MPCDPPRHDPGCEHAITGTLSIQLPPLAELFRPFELALPSEVSDGE